MRITSLLNPLPRSEQRQSEQRPKLTFGPITESLVLLQEALFEIPQLKGAGIDCVYSEVDMVRNLQPQIPPRVLFDVDQDCVHICVVEAGDEALGTSGVTSCVVLTARGQTDAPDENGNTRTVLGLLHLSLHGEEQERREALAALRTAMHQGGVSTYDVWVIGGDLSAPSTGIDGVIELVRAVQKDGNLQGARIGLTNSTHLDEEKMPDGMRSLPGTISVVMTAWGAFYAAENETPLFDRDVPTAGTPIMEHIPTDVHSDL